VRNSNGKIMNSATPLATNFIILAPKNEKGIIEIPRAKRFNNVGD
jgi:hypothetical protein